MPIEPLRFHAEVTRPGRKVSIVEATITRADSGAVLARAWALRIRTADVALPLHDAELAPAAGDRTSATGARARSPRRDRAERRRRLPQRGNRASLRSGHGKEAQVRSSTGSGSACRCSPTSHRHRCNASLAAVDNANGISHVLPWETYLFVNPDLTIQLFRPLRGEWVGMASATHHAAARCGDVGHRGVRRRRTRRALQPVAPPRRSLNTGGSGQPHDRVGAAARGGDHRGVRFVGAHHPLAGLVG